MKIIRRFSLLLFPFTTLLIICPDFLSSFGTAETIIIINVNVMAMVTMPPPPLKVRIASYNVLSSHLADPRHFSTLNPDHLSPSARLPVVLSKLQTEVDLQSIICLQEVSYDWAGSLHTYFANRGYHLVTGLYGKKFSGYMGVAVAWPSDKWQVLDVDISRLADKREGGWPKAPLSSDPGILLTRVWNRLAGTVRPYLEAVGVMYKRPIDEWEMASNRFNVLVTAKLQDVTTGRKFAIGNYHMPCAYYAPRVMTIHADLAARHVQRLAETESTADTAAGTTGTTPTTTSTAMPYVVAGDWNIKPFGSSYRLLTTGTMDVGDPEWPEPKFGVQWEPTAVAMRSAYAAAASDHGDGSEPDFTNYARVKEEEPFIDTLDYIFVSPEWTVEGVKRLPHRDDAGGPFPNLDRGEPSDHILIAADLMLMK